MPPDPTPLKHVLHEALRAAREHTLSRTRTAATSTSGRELIDGKPADLILARGHLSVSPSTSHHRCEADHHPGGGAVTGSTADRTWCSAVHCPNGPEELNSTARFGSRWSRFHSAVPRTGSRAATSQERQSESSRSSASG